MLTGKWIDEKNAYTYQLMGLRIDSLYRQWLKFTTTIKRPKQKKQNKATTWLMSLLSSIKDLYNLHIMPAFSENRSTVQ